MTTLFSSFKKPILMLAVFYAITYVTVIGRPALAEGPGTKITLKSSEPGTQGRKIRLVLHIVPPPSSDHPLHLHLYIDGRMVLMTTATKSLLTVSLPPLPAGRHEVGVMEADMVTHREMGKMGDMGDMKGMEGMDMEGEGMTPMSNAPSKKGFLARFTLIVKDKKP